MDCPLLPHHAFSSPEYRFDVVPEVGLPQRPEDAEEIPVQRKAIRIPGVEPLLAACDNIAIVLDTHLEALLRHQSVRDDALDYGCT